MQWQRPKAVRSAQRGRESQTTAEKFTEITVFIWILTMTLPIRHTKTSISNNTTGMRQKLIFLKAFQICRIMFSDRVYHHLNRNFSRRQEIPGSQEQTFFFARQKRARERERHQANPDFVAPAPYPCAIVAEPTAYNGGYTHTMCYPLCQIRKIVSVCFADWLEIQENH